MKIDGLVAEIGSTTTVVNAFNGMSTDTPCLLGQGVSATTVLEGDVTLGLTQAIKELEKTLGPLEYNWFYASSSAAGGLRMTVHGLVYDMTVKAANEAALGAGANVHMVTSGKLTEFDKEQLLAIKPHIILIAGGVDYGESETALFNAQFIASLKLNIPVIYAGNCVNKKEIERLFQTYNQESYLYITENVYPRIDELNILPTRLIIQQVFEEHIVEAKGMDKVRTLIKGSILPTPLSVMLATELLYVKYGDLITFDVGGATTDLHSVSDETTDDPEPQSKRTVEGDLGVYLNRHHLIERIGKEKLRKELKLSQETFEHLLNHFEPIPKDAQIPLVERLTEEACTIALKRHAGRLRHLYGIQGKTQVREGKDLSKVKFVLGTGGALTRLPHGKEVLYKMVHAQDPFLLGPTQNVQIYVDEHYIMSSCGVLSLIYPKQALNLLEKSLGIK